MKINSDINGNCEINVEFKNPTYYMVFTFISFITYATSIFYLLKSRE
jgi:hypothetical protein